MTMVTTMDERLLSGALRDFILVFNMLVTKNLVSVV